MANYKTNREIFSIALGIGFMVSVFLVGGAYLGSRLDIRFNTKPVLTLIFIGLGLFLSFYNFLKLIRE